MAERSLLRNLWNARVHWTLVALGLCQEVCKAWRLLTQRIPRALRKHTTASSSSSSVTMIAVQVATPRLGKTQEVKGTMRGGSGGDFTKGGVGLEEHGRGGRSKDGAEGNRTVLMRKQKHILHTPWSNRRVMWGCRFHPARPGWGGGEGRFHKHGWSQRKSFQSFSAVHLTFRYHLEVSSLCLTLRFLHEAS